MKTPETPLERGDTFLCHNCACTIAVFIIFSTLLSATSSAQCAAVGGTWLALTYSGKTLRLDIEQPEGSCLLAGNFSVDSDEMDSQIEGNVSGDYVVINVTSENSTRYLRGRTSCSYLELSKFNGRQWRHYATFRRNDGCQSEVSALFSKEPLFLRKRNSDEDVRIPVKASADSRGTAFQEKGEQQSMRSDAGGHLLLPMVEILLLFSILLVPFFPLRRKGLC